MDKLKTYLLSKLPFLNAGFVNIFLDNISGKLISWDGEDVGIDDRNGKYFYIREVGSESFRVLTNNAPKSLTSTQRYKMVLVAERLKMNDTKQCLINVLSNFEDLTLTDISNNLGEIVNSEYPKKNASEILEIMKNINFGTVISANFTMTKEIYINNCECQICEEC